MTGDLFLFYSDCKWVVDSFSAGRSYCTHPRCIGAAFWRRVFDAARDAFGSETSLSVVKVDAHRSVADCNENPDVIYKGDGNKLADNEASETRCCIASCLRAAR